MSKLNVVVSNNILGLTIGEIPTIVKGDTPVIASVDAVTGAEGSAASVVMGGTYLLPTFLFSIPKGDRGVQGLSGTISSITVNTLAAGSAASIVLNGTPENRSIVLNIPRGDKGDTGIKGDKGDASSKIINTKDNSLMDVWVGTQLELDAVLVKSPTVIYIVK